tara:strand:+ start:76 stop:393 length:318 start_codon:yes stop_codon:yes gene_type:complete
MVEEITKQFMVPIPFHVMPLLDRRLGILLREELAVEDQSQRRHDEWHVVRRRCSERLRSLAVRLESDVRNLQVVVSESSFIEDIQSINSRLFHLLLLKKIRMKFL